MTPDQQTPARQPLSPVDPAPEDLEGADLEEGRPETGEDELLMDGQEEVFSRSEVEQGSIEHHSLEEDVQPTPVDPDEAMADNFRINFNPRP